MTVPGKYLGTNGVGPDILGESSDPLVWTLCKDSRSSKSLRADWRLRRRMFSARPRAKSPRTPTLPPTAPANVAILCFFTALMHSVSVWINEDTPLKEKKRRQKHREHLRIISCAWRVLSQWCCGETARRGSACISFRSRCVNEVVE